MKGQGPWGCVWKFSGAAGVGVLLVFHVIVNISWLHVDNHPYFGDEQLHMNWARDYALALNGWRDGGELVVREYASPSAYPKVKAWRPVSRWMDVPILMAAVGSTSHPPLTHVVGGICSWVLGFRPHALALGATVAFCVTIIFSYLIARQSLAKPEALFAAFVVSFTPILYGSSRYLSTDVFATSCVCMAIWALGRVGGFRQTGAVIAFGLLGGLGFLARPNVMVYWMLPLAAVLLPSVIETYRAQGTAEAAKLPWSKLLRNIVLCAILGILVPLPWYWGNAVPLASHWEANHEKSGLISTHLSLSTFLEYPSTLVANGVLLPLFMVGVCGVFCGIVRGRKYPGMWIVTLWLLSTYFLMSALFQHHLVRYFMPAIPALAILAAFAVVSIRRAAIRWTAGGALAIYLMVQFIILTWSPAWLPAKVSIPPGRVESGTESAKNDGVFIFRNHLFSGNHLFHDNYAYYPASAFEGENYFQRLFERMADDSVTRAAQKTQGPIYFQTVSQEHNLSDCAFYREMYSPGVFPFGVNRWSKGRCAKYPLVWANTISFPTTPDDTLHTLDATDYVIFSVEDGGGDDVQKETEYQAFFEARGFEVLDRFIAQPVACFPAMRYTLMRVRI